MSEKKRNRVIALSMKPINFNVDKIISLFMRESAPMIDKRGSSLMDGQ
ncbi:hypothetical protein [Acetobacterium paludosum]|nr:hypothetical protein [Acetobacterium paludosum]